MPSSSSHVRWTLNRHAVLEDREPGIARRELVVDELECLLQRPTTILDRARSLQRGAQEGACRRSRWPPHRRERPARGRRRADAHQARPRGRGSDQSAGQVGVRSGPSLDEVAREADARPGATRPGRLDVAAPRARSSTLRLPRSSVSSSSNVTVGWVRPESSRRRGRAAASGPARSPSPAGSLLDLRAFVLACATIRRAPNADAPSARTAW